MKLLFATRTSPFAGDSGSGAYVSDFLHYLAAHGFAIHLAWTEPPDLNPTRGWYTPPAETSDYASLQILNMHRVGPRFFRPEVIWLPFKARAAHRAKTTLRALGLWRSSNPASRAADNASPAPAATSASGWGAPASPAEIAFLQAAATRLRPDVILANYAWIAPAFPPSPLPLHASPPLAVLTHDVRHRQLHLIDGRATEIFNEHTSLDAERAMLAPADALIAIQSVEAGVFSRLFPEKKIVAAPMSAPLRPLPAPAAPAALFVGSNHAPNLAGLRWLLARVWPEILRELPAARLLIAGSICATLTEALPAGVEKLGRLSEIATAYAQASVVIAPLLQGSGLKIKILEALSFGRPVVTTSIGAEGFENFLPALRVADSPETFARETIALLRDRSLATDTAQTLQTLARTHLSPDACYAPVARLLRELAARKYARA